MKRPMSTYRKQLCFVLCLLLMTLILGCLYALKSCTTIKDSTVVKKTDQAPVKDKDQTRIHCKIIYTEGTYDRVRLCRDTKTGVEYLWTDVGFTHLIR